MNLLARNLDRLPLMEMITHRMPLERAAEAVELAQRDGTMKVLMDPWFETLTIARAEYHCLR